MYLRSRKRLQTEGHQVTVISALRRGRTSLLIQWAGLGASPMLNILHHANW